MKHQGTKHSQFLRIGALAFAVSVLVLCSCSKQTEGNELESNSTIVIDQPKTESIADFDFNRILSSKNENLLGWVNYYSSSFPQFSLDSFKHNRSAKHSQDVNSRSYALNSKNDSIYRPFYIYNSDSSKFIDLDSYLWFIDDDGSVLFSVDQEVTLNTKLDSVEVQRLTFMGPSASVETAAWLDSSTIVLPISESIGPVGLLIIDLKKNEEHFFLCDGDWTLNPNYFEHIRTQKGLQIE